jgi:hypothetical protein
MKRGKRLVSSLLDLSDLSRRDDRTEPGVLTPGTDKRRIRPEGAVGCIATRKMRKGSGRDCLPAFSAFVRPIPRTMTDRQGGLVMWIIPGLKPRAESFYPFGISSLPTVAVA